MPKNHARKNAAKTAAKGGKYTTGLRQVTAHRSSVMEPESFTSGTQCRDYRTVNHDHFPWEGTDQFGMRVRASSPGPEAGMWRYRPRPEYAIIDNPVLAAWRTYICGTQEYAVDTSGMNSDDVEQWLSQHTLNPDVTPTMIKHARRVLNRLAALYW